jgi:hypothetical protein
METIYVATAIFIAGIFIGVSGRGHWLLLMMTSLLGFGIAANIQAEWFITAGVIGVSFWAAAWAIGLAMGMTGGRE